MVIAVLALLAFGAATAQAAPYSSAAHIGLQGAGVVRQPDGITHDSAGNVYVADTENHVIRKITPAGVVSVLAGMDGVSGPADGAGAAARFNQPRDITVDASDNLYVADLLNGKIRKIVGNVVTTLASGLAGPVGVACDSASAGSNVYVADSNDHKIHKVTQAGVVSVFAGSTFGYADGTGTGAQFKSPTGVATDSADNVYVADSANCVIRKITPAGAVSTVAGQPTVCGSSN
jgi:sugar lactone lactonase YvrE